MNHHYIPQFYLREWTDSTSKLWRYQKEYGNKISEKSVSPKSTASKEDLYAIHVGCLNPDGDPQVLEKKVFGPIDADGASALGKLGSGNLALDPVERKGWALFLLSLIHRHASDIQMRDEIAPVLAEDVKSQMLGASPTEKSRQDMALILSKLDLAGMSRDLHRGLMVQRIRAPNSLERLMAMQWIVVPCPLGRPYITTDQPLLMNLGRGGPLELLTMALSPTILFLACPDSWSFDNELESLVLHLAKFHNFFLLKNQPQCVYSSTKIVDDDTFRLRLAVDQVLLEGKG